MLPLPIPDPHAESRRKFDEEIAELEARLLSLKLARNALAPISRLHPEVLQEIFVFAHTTSGWKGRTSLLLTWVSHTWRDLAHDTSDLWTHIDFKNPEWVQAALSLTKNRDLTFHPIHLMRNKDNTDIAGFAALCLRNLCRIRELVLMTREWIFPTHSPEWMTPAPNLVHLHLDSFTLPPNVFSGTFPAIETLHLSWCMVDWDTLPVRPGLKELVLTDTGPQASFDEAIRIFQIVGPELEYLHLRDIFLDDDGSPPTTKIHFGKLTNLKLEEDSPEVIASCLALMSFPSKISIELSTTSLRDEMISALIDSRNIENWPARRLEITATGTSTTYLIVEDWSNVDGIAGERHSNQTHIQLSFDEDDNMPTHPILDLLPIHPIENVVLHALNDDIYILNHIQNMGTVRELDVKLHSLLTFEHFIEDLLDALRAEVGYEGGPDLSKLEIAQQILSFQELRILRICGREEGETRMAGLDLNRLHTWLIERKLYGIIMLEELYLSDMVSSYPVDWIQNGLGRFVGELEVHNVVDYIPVSRLGGYAS